MSMLQAEANKENNFSEPWSQIFPQLPGSNDPSSDHFRGW
jgi:hypothetical protein